MLNALKKWTLVAAAFAGALFASGCLFGNKSWWLIEAILNEDIFG